MLVEENRLTDLHLCIKFASGLSVTHSSTDVPTQANLLNDVKCLVREYLTHLKEPLPNQASWDAATFEIISEDTRRYLEQLTELLEEIEANTEDDELAARIEKILR